VRGHTLVWGQSADQGYPPDLPERIRNAPDPEGFTREAIRDHVFTVVGRYRGRVETWDVVNEPLAPVGGGFDRNVLYEAMGESYVSEALLAARAADPDARLVINEYFFTYSGGKAADFIDLVSGLLDADIPIDGVGIQGHVYIMEPGPGELKGFLAALASLGLEIEFTELDILKLSMLGRLARGEDLFEAQADVYGSITRACVETAACRGITVWGTDDGHTWFDVGLPFTLFAPNEPLLLDRSLEPKPAYHVVKEEIANRKFPHMVDVNE
jgi:endo-1,4-beta-xylanase